jgi:hypothetical protein
MRYICFGLLRVISRPRPPIYTWKAPAPLYDTNTNNTSSPTNNKQLPSSSLGQLQAKMENGGLKAAPSPHQKQNSERTTQNKVNSKG